MNEILLWILAAMIFGALLRVVARPRRIYEYPYFMAAAFGIFILPQAISLVNEPLGVAYEAIGTVLLVGILCLAMCFLGAFLPISRGIVKLGTFPINENRLFLVGVMFTLIGLVANYLVGQAAQELTGLWTGRVTLYHFFSSLLLPAFAITLRYALLRGGLVPWIVTGIAAYNPVLAVVFYGRREAAAQLLFTVGLLLFYIFRKVPSRAVLLGLGAFATLMIPAVGLYRTYAREAGFGSLQHFDAVSVFQQYLGGAGILELRSAAWLIDAASTTGLYEWGTGYWDEIVFRYVPAQLVGSELKNSLMFNWSQDTLWQWLWGVGYDRHTGLTITGLGDSFVQFGYFGCLFFAVMAIFFRSWWVASLKPGATLAQLFYICSMTSGMRAVTHQTSDFLPDVLFNVVFLGGAVWLASAGARRVDSRHRHAPLRS